MKKYALDYKEKKCIIEGKEITYNEVYLLYDLLEVKVTIPKEIKTQVVESIDKGKAYLTIELIAAKEGTTYQLCLYFNEYVMPLNNKIFSNLELYVLNNYEYKG